MITLVSGLPRSGTSMMMRILEAGGIPPLADGERAADVDNPHGYYELEAVKSTREDPSWLERADGRATKVIYKLLYDLPDDSREDHVVFMQRALKEVIASQEKMLVRRGAASAGSAPSVDLVAAFAGEVARCKAWLRERPRFHVVYMNYNQLLEDPSSGLARLAEFLGPCFDPARAAAAIDPSLYRNRA